MAVFTLPEPDFRLESAIGVLKSMLPGAGLSARNCPCKHQFGKYFELLRLFADVSESTDNGI
jgi:hypothetical protein